MFFSFAFLGLVGMASASAQEFQYAVRHHHLLKDCRGILQITAEGVTYRTDDSKDNRKWSFDDIQVLEINSPTEISIGTYEDQKRWAGKDKVFELILLNKKATPVVAL